MSKATLAHLPPKEQQAILEFVHLLAEDFNGRIHSALLFGSKARGEDLPGSDLDVLIVIDSDDWRVHKQIRYLAADICLKYDLNLSPRVWSVAHHQEEEEFQTSLYRNICQDGINLLELLSAG